MIETLSFTLANDLSETVAKGANDTFRITAADSNGDTVFDHSWMCYPSAEMIQRPVYAASTILDGESLVLFETNKERQRVELVSQTDGVAISIREFDSQQSSCIIEPCPLDREVLLDGVLAFATEYLEQRQAALGDETCTNTMLVVGIKDAERRRTYYREHGTQNGYEPSIDRDHLETFVLHCFDNDPLREYIISTDNLQPFVRSLTESDDDEFVSDCYRNLLGFYEELIEPTAATLETYPDNRARTALIGALWTNTPKRVATVEALQQVPNADVIENLVDVLEVYDDDPDAAAVCTAAAEVLRSIDPTAHVDDGLDSILSRIENALDTDHGTD